MKGTLEIRDDGWTLKTDNGKEINSGDFPLVEDDEFIRQAASKLDVLNYTNKPYNVVDNRDTLLE